MAAFEDLVRDGEGPLPGRLRYARLEDRAGECAGAFPRENAGKLKADRGAFLESALNEKTYDVIEELQKIAKAHGSTPARIALSWVPGCPGVASTIIGARRLAQLEDNVQALDVVLTPEERARLDAMTQPKFGFPQSMQPMFPAIHHGGMSVNGVYAPTSPFVLQEGDKPY